MFGRELGGRRTGWECNKLWRIVRTRANCLRSPFIRQRQRDSRNGAENDGQYLRGDLSCGEPLLKHRVVIRVEIPQLRLGRVVCVDMRQMHMQETATVVLRTLMLVNMRNWSLHERQKQGQNDTRRG